MCRGTLWPPRGRPVAVCLSWLYFLVTGISVAPKPADSGPHAVLENMRVGALEAGSWNGIVFVIDDATAFQVRVGVATEFGDLLDGDGRVGYRLGSHPLKGKTRTWQPFWREQPLFHSIAEVGAKATDLSYSNLAWNPLYPYDTGSRLRFEWSRIDAATVLGKVTYEGVVGQIDYNFGSRAADIVLEAFSPWKFPGEYRVHDGEIRGKSEYQAVLGEIEWNRWKFQHSSKNADLNATTEPGFSNGYHESSRDDSQWPVVFWNSYWQESPGISSSGYGWYRHSLVIPASWKGRQLQVSLGKIAEEDRAFLNGHLIGTTTDAAKDRIYHIRPGESAYQNVRWGEENLIAFQVRSRASLGGMSHGKLQLGWKSYPGQRPRILALEEGKRMAHFAVAASKLPSSAGSFHSLDDLQKQFQQTGQLSTQEGQKSAGLHIRDLHLESKERSADNVIYFVCGVDRDEQNLGRRIRDLLRTGSDKLSERLELAANAYDKSRVKAAGCYDKAAEMATNTLHWAELYGPAQKRTFVVDARRWIAPDHWFLAANSAVMGALAASLENQRLAQETFRGIFAEAFPDGRVPNIAGPVGISTDRSEDMYAAYSAWRIYRQWGDKEFLRSMYEPIKRWHEWWFADRGDGQPWRDGNKNGLLELGSNASPFNTPQPPRESEQYGIHHQGAMWESGYDDNPSWGHYDRGPAVHPPQYRGEAGVDFIFRTGTLNIDTVLTNSLWAINADMLARIAGELGYAEEQQRYVQQHRRIAERINQRLWDDSRGIYADRIWDEAGGRFSSRKTPMMFYMMAAGVASPEQAARLVKEHLLNPKEFWGDYVLPTVSRDDPTYPEQYYWRGSIWPPMNYFTYEGLKRYGFDQEAAELVRKTYEMVKLNWDRDGGLYENYLSINGLGNPWKGQTTLHYSWSATLPAMAIMESVDLEPWGGLRFGSMRKDKGNVENLNLGGNVYSVTIGTETILKKDGHEVFRASGGPVVVRDWRMDQEIQFRLKTNEEAVQIVLPASPVGLGAAVELQIDGKRVSAPSLTNQHVKLIARRGDHLYRLRRANGR